jgi:hypothetical protein
MPADPVNAEPAGELIDLGEIRLRLLVTRATARHVG